MKEYAFYSAMEQSPRKFKQAAHSLAFLCRFTPVSHTKMKNWSLRQCVKQAKKYGWMNLKTGETILLSKETNMSIDDLYALIEEVELEQKYLFVVYDIAQDDIGIDVLDYESEDCIDGGYFNSIEEVIEFVKEHKGSL